MTSNTLRSLGLATLVVGMALFGSVAFAGSAAAASNGSISADPADPGANSTHTATLTVGSAATGSLNGFAVDYTETDGDAGNVGTEDVATVGIDRGDDSDGDAVDESVSDDLSAVSASNNGGTLNLNFGGSYTLDAGDEVVVVFEDVVNPTSEGDHEVSLEVNPQSSGGEGAATLSVGASDSDPATTTSDDGSDTSTDSDDDSDTTTESGGAPGFGVAVALVGLLAAGALALRRE